MNRKEFLRGVAEELHTLKRNATPEEIERLKFSKYSQSSVKEDIFGQMTGQYKSIRANEIVKKQYDDTFGRFSDDNFKLGSESCLIDKYMTINYVNCIRKDVFDFIKGKKTSITLEVDDETLEIHSSGTKDFQIHQVKEIEI